VATLQVKSFKGGITDDAVAGQPDQYTKADNLLIGTPGEDLISRPGSVIIDTANGQLPSGNQRVSGIYNYENSTALLASSARRVFRKNGAWSELLGPTGNLAFDVATAAAAISQFQWRGHLFLSNDELPRPIKIFKNQAGAYKLLAAGLPNYPNDSTYDSVTTATASIVALANDLRTKMLAHYNDITVHPGGLCVFSIAEITAGALSIGDSLATVATLVGQLNAAYKVHYTDAIQKTGDRFFHSNALGPNPGAPNIMLSNSLAPESWLEVAQSLNDLKRKHNWHVRAYKGHASVGAGVVTAATLTNTEEGPSVSNQIPSKLVDFINDVKAKFNFHTQTSSNHATATEDPTAQHYEKPFADLRDPGVTLADATAGDGDSIFELAVHLHQAYSDHDADAAAPVYALVGDSTPGFPDDKIKDLANGGTYEAFSGGPAPFGITEFTSIWTTDLDEIEGWYLGLMDNPVGVDSYPSFDDKFPYGAQITTPLPLFSDLSMDIVSTQSRTGAAGGFKAYVIANKKYHSPRSNAQTNKTASSPAAIADYATLLGNYAAIDETMRDIAAKMVYHVQASDYHGALSRYEDPIAVPDALITKTYKYAFVFANEYTLSSGETFRDVSKPYLKQVTVFLDGINSGITITNIAVIANGATDNYDTTNTKVEIYRSTDTGITPKLVAQIANGTTTFTDTVDDSELDSRPALYTDGGVVDNDSPPRAKYIHMAGEFAYYGNIVDDDTSESLPRRIRQAIADDPDSCPGDFYVDLPSDVAGISSARRIPITWTKTGTYRLEGSFDETGQGSIIAIAVSDTVGLLGGSSPVQIDGGVVFAGTDGFYFTDGYRMIKLSRRWNTTYRLITATTQQARQITGVYEPKTNRVWWGGSYAGGENDRCFVLDLNYGISEAGAPFTTASNSTHFAPTCLGVFNGQLLRGDSRGYVFKHDEAYLTDPAVDTLTSPTLWTTATIVWDYISIAFDFGESRSRKWVTKIITKLANEGNVTVQIKSINDLGRQTKSLTPIKFRGGTTGAILEKRHFPTGSLRCDYKQIQMTNAVVGAGLAEKLNLIEYNINFELLGDTQSNAKGES
jgi:hypothetical protein